MLCLCLIKPLISSTLMATLMALVNLVKGEDGNYQLLPGVKKSVAPVHVRTSVNVKEIASGNNHLLCKSNRNYVHTMGVCVASTEHLSAISMPAVYGTV